MRLIQGFVTKDSFIINQDGQVNEFFELSPLSLTFSKERGEYQSIANVGDILHTFTTRDTTTGLGFTLDAVSVSDTLSITGAILAYCSGNTFSSTEFINFIRTSFNGKIVNFTHGALYEGNLYSIPDWSAWTLMDGTEVRIWHRDEAFQNQYSFYEIVTVAPLDNIDQFFSRYSDMVSRISALSISAVMERIQTAKGVYPDTYTRILTFKLHNQNNVDQSIDTQWGVLVYGKNGDNIDSIKDAIVDFLLNNSTHSEAEWKVIFPEIFMRTEFAFYPRWDKVAIRNTAELGSIYSAVYKPTDMLDHVISNSPSPITQTFASNNLSVMPFDYKSITCGVICGSTNLAAIDDITEIFPDYIPVNTSSLDFNRMSHSTREWVLKMVELIRIAETVTEYSTVINPMRRVTRNGKLFVCFVYDNVNFLVSAKKNTIL